MATSTRAGEAASPSARNRKKPLSHVRHASYGEISYSSNANVPASPRILVRQRELVISDMEGGGSTPTMRRPHEEFRLETDIPK